MSNPLVFPPSQLGSPIEDLIRLVFADLIRNAGGKVVRSDVLSDRIEMVACLHNNYYLYLYLDKLGNGYVVDLFFSIEAVDTLGKNHYMQAENTLAYALKAGETWLMTTCGSLTALFDAHTKWSRVEGLQAVFAD